MKLKNRMKFSIDKLDKKLHEMEHGFHAVLDYGADTYTMLFDKKLKCITVSDGETVSLYHLVRFFKKHHDYGEAYVFIVTDEMRARLISVLVDEHAGKVLVNEYGKRVHRRTPSFEWI